MVSYPFILYKITEVMKSNYFLSVFVLLVFLISLGNDVVEFLTLIMMMPIKRRGGSKAKYMASVPTSRKPTEDLFTHLTQRPKFKPTIP